MLSIVPQRRSAKAAEDKLKQSSTTLRASATRITASPSPSRTNATRSRSTSTTTPNSSASSPTDRPPSTRKKASIISDAPQPTEAAPSERESSLSEESDAEDDQDEVVQPGRRASPVKRTSSGRKKASKPTSIKSDPQQPSANTDDSLVDDDKASQPEPGPSASASASDTPTRGSSKRSAARAAQNNIQRSYSEFFVDEPAEDERPATPAKKPRTSAAGGRAKAAAERKQTDSEFRSPSASKSRSKSSTSRTSGAAVSASHLARRFKDDDGIVWELQFTTCQAQRYARYRKCVHCIAKQVGDTCRFAHFRAFAINPETDDLDPPNDPDSPKPVFISFPDADDIMQLPSERLLSPDRRSETLAIVGKSLLPVLEAELAHATHPQVLRRPREKICRQMCEFCATSIFSSSWFCRRCGREYCSDCKHTIEHKQDISDAAIAKRMTLCDKARSHSASDLVPLTRFDVALLEQEVTAMRALLQRNEPNGENTVTQTEPEADLNKAVQSEPNEGNREEAVKINWEDIPSERAGLTADNMIGSLKLRTFDSDTFNTDVFRREWAHGEPLLVRNVITPMQHTWDPKQLIARYGKESCAIVRSDTDPPTVKEVYVGKFFDTFGKDRETKEEVLGEGSWKLKDWPPSAEFKAEFPELYEDFNRAVPAPEYTTREGVLNLGSCYPTGVIQPDLGPKMYNAWPASEGEGEGGNGTTRLHMDIADAVNIMLYAAPSAGDDVPEEHQPGVAAWDIFRAEDADILRTFLREEHAKLNFKDDPIHIQRFFISAPQRVKLWQKYGVKSWRIYQKAGEAVFIPAGCAHQVCNLTDCIKVAVDFVSPQNVERCFKLTAEFRSLVNDYKKAWKEDVLSLRTTLWYAWCTYREMDNMGPNVWAAEQAQQEQREEVPRVSRIVVQGE